MSDDAIEGSFHPPVRPKKDDPKPVAIAGKGRLAITDGALVAHGFRPRTPWLLMAASAIAGGAAALGGAWLVSHYLFHAAFTAQAAAPALVFAALSAIAVPRGASKTPLEIAMPWSTIRGVATAKDDLGAPILHVLTDEVFPMRAIYFRPTDLNAAIAQLSAARDARA